LRLAFAAILLVAAGPLGWTWPGDRPPPRVPVDNAMSAAKVELGRRLFYDADLSIDGSMSCATCHVQRRAFADGNATHPGVHGDPGRRNVPGLSNIAWAKSLTWGDPRVATLEAQVLIPVAGLAPVEMGMNGKEADIADRLGKDGCYVRMFGDAFPETAGRIDMGSAAKALAAFQRTMISNQSPYDRWRGGTRDALGEMAVSGERAFRKSCASCHAGPDLSDGRFHAVVAGSGDRGLGEITGRRRDDGRFRTPGLRNLALTAPYLHDGSAPTIAAAIDRHGAIAFRLGADEKRAIEAFLNALTDRAFTGDRRLSLPQSACGVAL
jgi:cytochrome c peroxidase